MPTLNWKEKKPSFALVTGSSPKNYLCVEWDPSAISDFSKEFQAALQEVFPSDATAGSELRWELPEGWTLFLRQAAGSQSRLLLAHPELSEWVGTLLLAPAHAQVWISNLKRFFAGEISRVQLSEACGTPHFLSNFDLQMGVKESQ